MAIKSGQPSACLFTYQGRNYNIFTRSNEPESLYYINVQVAGKRHQRCLDTHLPEIAIGRAKILIDRLYAEHWQDLAKQPLLFTEPAAAPAPELTLSSVLAVYRVVATISPRTVKTNILSLLKIIERTNGSRRDAEKIYLSEITRQLAMKFQDLTVMDYTRGKAEHEIREARERALRSSRSTICQARSIFSRNGDQDLISRYSDHGLTIPACVSEFVGAKLRGRKSRLSYTIPSDAVIQRTFEEIATVKDDLPVFLGFWFAVGAGLRRKEIRMCRWEHVIESDGQLWIVGGTGKDGENINVRMQKRAAEAVTPYRKDRGWIISERSDRWAKRLCRWMRGLGWTSAKLLHELRAYSGSLLYQESPVQAMRWLRHKSLRVTEQHYVRYGCDTKPLDVL